MPPKKAKKQEGIKKGKIILKPNLTVQQKKALQDLAERVNLNGFRWQLVNGTFVECKVKCILEAAQQLNINHLTLNNNQNCNIISDICIFRLYHKLQNLILRQNRIQSIQLITQLDAPLLWRIDFGQNFITSMKSFRKLHCAKLVMFRIGDNKITDLGQLQYCYSPQLHEITVQSNYYLTDLTPIIKLQSNQFKYIYSYNSKIVMPKNLEKAFINKYSQQLVMQI